MATYLPTYLSSFVPFFINLLICCFFYLSVRFCPIFFSSFIISLFVLFLLTSFYPLYLRTFFRFLPSYVSSFAEFLSVIWYTQDSPHGRNPKIWDDGRIQPSVLVTNPCPNTRLKSSLPAFGWRLNLVVNAIETRCVFIRNAFFIWTRICSTVSNDVIKSGTGFTYVDMRLKF
jgi:hypothetical protein